MTELGKSWECRKCGVGLWDFEDACAGICGDCNIKEIELLSKKQEGNYRERMINFPNKYLEIIKNIEEKKARGVFLWGKCGTGKTVDGCAISMAFAKKMYRVHFYSCPMVIMKLQSMAKKEGEHVDDYIMQLCTLKTGMRRMLADNYIHIEGDVLFLDDLGAEKMTDFVRQSLYAIINYREQHELPTIITSNYNLSNISGKIDDRIASRIAGMCEVIEIKGNDRRLSGKK